MDESTFKFSRRSNERETPEPRLALSIAAHPRWDRWGDTALIDGGTEITRGAPAFSPPGGGEASPLAAPHVSRRPVVRIEGDPRGARVRCVHSDAWVRVGDRDLATGAAVTVSAAALERGVLITIEGFVGLLLHTRTALPESVDALGIIGISPQIEAVRDRIRSVAGLDMAVLIRGESGTGKELAAQAIHAASERRDRALRAVNLGALAQGVVASTLFGHVRGAFTGADDKRTGLFRMADGGTLFLDEIGEASAEVQTALLRVLETGEVLPVGSDRPDRVDVRVVAATDARLEAAFGDDSFRLPLFHRLAEFPIAIPALRERPVDIPVLLRHFLRAQPRKLALERHERTEMGWVPGSVLELLTEWRWPGNVRELRNVVGASAVHSAELEAFTLSPHFVANTEADHDEAPEPTAEPSSVDETEDEQESAATGRSLDEINDEELLQALADNDWRPGPAARALGIARTSIYQLIRNHPQIPQSQKLAKADIEAAIEEADGDEAAAARALRVPKRGLLHRMKKLDMR